MFGLETKAKVEDIFCSCMESPLSHTGPKTSKINYFFNQSLYSEEQNRSIVKFLQRYVVIFESNYPKDRPKTTIFLVKCLT